MAVSLPGLKKPMTADELFKHYNSTLGKHELVRGQLVVMEPVGTEHGAVALSVGSVLLMYARENALGTVFVETGFILQRNPDTVRAPDVSFVAAERMKRLTRDERRKYFVGHPDLAVEVISPDERWRNTEEKIADCFTAGTQLFWIVDPQKRRIIVRKPDGTSQLLSEDNDQIDGGNVLPGFSATVRELLAAR